MDGAVPILGYGSSQSQLFPLWGSGLVWFDIGDRYGFALDETVDAAMSASGCSELIGLIEDVLSRGGWELARTVLLVLIWVSLLDA
ncbi:hypothetical protein M0R45_031436 [Rubus argutus]|uniref:Uncharacterized protein n=1 Tax=Rubus argutus TaxID=59490 RepID=A0AAW1WDK3_RUBAR